MKPNNFFIEIAGKVIFRTTIIAFVASSSILSGCKKQSAAEPNTTEERTSGFVQSNPKSNHVDDTGTSNGFFWSLYREGGSATLTNGSAGNFSITYNNVTDVVGGKGWNPGSARNIGYNIGSLTGSYNFVGVYGWTTSPLIEYYVAEKGSIVSGTQVNTVSSDGNTYSFYKHQQVNKPSIIGTATFWQYLDNWGGTSTGANHSVNMANHINNWNSRGGQGFGSYNYQIFGLEAFSGKSGYINATVW